MTTTGTTIELVITSLAAGGDGVGRDDSGRVTFVPRTAVGDRARVKIVHATKSFARAELVELVEAAPSRVVPPCPHYLQGCGGCQWQHVDRAAQLAAKHAIVSGALRKLADLVVHPVEDPAPPFGWRRRARFHVVGGRVGLYAYGTQQLVPIAACPQLEPPLEGVLALVNKRTPPDGELELLLAHDGRIAIATERPWRGGAALVGQHGIAGIVGGTGPHATRGGDPLLEIEPGLWAGPRDFAQASRAGNTALVARVLAAVGAPSGTGRLLELHAGAGNFSRALDAAGWEVHASDVAAPVRPAVTRFVVGSAAEVLAAHVQGGARSVFDALVLDPPRTGARDAVDGIAKLAPPIVVYVSCDTATLARDLEALGAQGYRATDAWPIDLMPQTAHVEVVARVVRG